MKYNLDMYALELATRGLGSLQDSLMDIVDELAGLNSNIEFNQEGEYATTLKELNLDFKADTLSLSKQLGDVAFVMENYFAGIENYYQPYNEKTRMELDQLLKQCNYLKSFYLGLNHRYRNLDGDVVNRRANELLENINNDLIDAKSKNNEFIEQKLLVKQNALEHNIQVYRNCILDLSEMSFTRAIDCLEYTIVMLERMSELEGEIAFELAKIDKIPMVKDYIIENKTKFTELRLNPEKNHQHAIAIREANRDELHNLIESIKEFFTWTTLIVGAASALAVGLGVTLTGIAAAIVGGILAVGSSIVVGTSIMTLKYHIEHKDYYGVFSDGISILSPLAAKGIKPVSKALDKAKLDLRAYRINNGVASNMPNGKILKGEYDTLNNIAVSNFKKFKVHFYEGVEKTAHAIIEIEEYNTIYWLLGEIFVPEEQPPKEPRIIERVWGINQIGDDRNMEEIKDDIFEYILKSEKNESGR